MKEKLALVIAALLITSMAFAMSTTTITAPSTISASPGATLEAPDPATARADTRVLITVKVTNPSTETDNIDNVRIAAPAGAVNFSEGIGGASAAENLKLAADNLENAVIPLQNAGENLKDAEDNKIAAGQALNNASDDLADAVVDATLWGIGTLNTNLTSAANNIDDAGDNLRGAPENWAQVEVYLTAAGSAFSAAGINLYDDGSSSDEEENAGDRLDNYVDNYLDLAAVAIGGGSLRAAGENLKIAADNLDNAGDELALMSGAGENVGGHLILVAADLLAAADYLIAAADADNNAGQNLVTAAAYLSSAGRLIELADTTDLKAAGDNIENAAAQIDVAGDNLSAVDDNVQQAGENLSIAADNLATAATELGAALGGDELADMVTDENAAAENLRDVNQVDLTTAGNKLIDAASDLSAAATVLEAAADALEPDTWTAIEGTQSGGEPYVQFNVIGDNVIIPGGDETFSFLWKTPNIGVENDYVLTISSHKEGTAPEALSLEATVTLTVDGKTPTLIIQVTHTQTVVVDKNGLEVPNLVGTEFDNARAKITITASEVLSSLGTVYLENAGGAYENLLPSIAGSAFSTTDNTVFTYQYITVDEWDDNGIRVRVTSAKDIVGNENTADMENTVTVDTRAPIFEDNGLVGLIAAMARTNVSQAGTNTVFNYVDNNADQSLTIEVEDNVTPATGAYVISVTVDTTAASRSTGQDNFWSLTSLTMSEGLTSVLTVTATDRTGNTVSDNIENIFIDTQQPAISFSMITNKIGGEETEVTFDSGIRINDNTPKIKITVTDPGYPTSGLGVARKDVVGGGLAENFLYVALDNDDNIWNVPTYWRLENKDAWVVTTGIFENIIENTAGGGLLDGTYYISVWAPDNLIHPDNENGAVESRSFIIDTHIPVAPTIESVLTGAPNYTTVDDPLKVTKVSRTITGTAEIGAKVVVYLINTDTGVENELDPVTAGSDNKWTASFSLTPGELTKIQILQISVAGVESGRALYGFILADATAPTLTLTALDETTDKAGITVSGTVTKDTWETWAMITVYVQVGLDVATVPVVEVAGVGTWSVNVSLSEGPNSIIAWAEDPLGNTGDPRSDDIERTVTPWATYAIIVVIVALILAAIAIFRKR